MKKLIKNKAGVSAVIGVILMIAITVALAVTVYVYVSGLNPDSEADYVYKTGILQGYYTVNSVDPVIIGNEVLEVRSVDESYLSHFIGQDITLILQPVESNYYDYRYIGAYLNLEE